MKLNKFFNKNIVIFTLFTIIILYDHCVLNLLEKMFSEVFFDFTKITRPWDSCSNLSNMSLKCVGLPSGHAQTITVLSLLLYNYDFISLPIAILLILIFSLQRVIIQAHTVIQIILGILLGCVYSYIYIANNLSYKSFLYIAVITFVLILTITCKIETELYHPIPNWVDPEMISSIEKKRSSPVYLKLLPIIANLYIQGKTFISWNELENNLDILIEKLKQTNVRFDGIVGIKTGGAIISDYISKKLNIPNYKIKISRSEYKCDKNPIDTFNDIYQRNVVGNLGEYSICQGIHQDLQGQNLIVIDEMITTGKTMFEAINYLKYEKKVHSISPVCISFSKNRFKFDYKLFYTINNIVVVWPWGYDN